MSLCQLRPQILQQVGGLANSKEYLAIVPDIQGYDFGSDLQGYKRYRNDSDCLSGGEEDITFLDQQQLDSFAFSSAKRHCNYNYNITPSPDQTQFAENISAAGEVFTVKLKESYNFGTIEDSDTLFCGNDSPVSTSSEIDFASTSSNTQTSIGCQQIFDIQAFVPLDLLPNMQQPQTLLSHQVEQHAEKYKLVITEQPEEYYRARYNSEGVRAPLKGMTENYPTVQVFGPDFRYGRIDVKLVHEDGTPHTSCSLDTSEGRKNAVSKKIGPFNRMIVEFEDLRIRRVKKEGRKKSANMEKSTPKDGRSDKIASLLFTATLEMEHGEIVQSIQSRQISLTAAPEPAELDWLEPNRGHFAGQEPLVIKGSKMTSPKVTFRILLPDGRRQELHGSVDKERSHQNVLLVKTPSLNQVSYQFAHQTIRAEVVVITGRNQMASNALQFDFIPNHICRECMQETPRPAHMTTTYSACSPTTIPSYPAPSTGGHSPPPTPGLPTKASPSPNETIQTPTQIQLPAQTTQSGYSQAIVTPLPVMAETMTSPSSSGNLISPDIVTINCSLPSQEAVASSGKGRDDILIIMQDLMGVNSNSLSVNLNMHGKDIESHVQYLYGSPQSSYGQLEGHMQQAASPYVAANSPSAASDQPCYSPVTPVQSPPNSPWNYVEQMLSTLFRNDQISHQYFRFLQNECTKQNPYLLQAFNTSQSNEGVFLQLLASYKSDQSSFQATHQ